MAQFLPPPPKTTLTPRSKGWGWVAKASLAAGAAAAVGVALIAYERAVEDPCVRKERREARRRRKAQSAKGLDLAQLKLVFGEIIEGLNSIMGKLYNIEQKVRQQCKAQGQALNDVEIRNALTQRWAMMMKQMEDEVYKKYGITEAQAKAATVLHKNDPDIKKHVDKIKKVFELLSGQQEQTALPEVPESVNPDRVLKLMQAMSDEICDAIEKIITDHKESLGVTTNDEFRLKCQENQGLLQQIQQQYIAKSNEIRKKQQQEQGITDERVLQAAVQKYQHNEDFMRQMMAITNQQQQKFAELGMGP